MDYLSLQYISAIGGGTFNAGANSTNVAGNSGFIYTNSCVPLVVAFSNNADLSALITTVGAISPTFTSGIITYTASVSNATTGITLTPTRSESNATITVNGIAVTSGSASGNITLTVGANVITTIVTAQDGSTKTYTITVTRAEYTQTVTVTSIADDGTSGTLRWAIEQANNIALSINEINFNAGLTGTITLTSNLPNISETLTITGPGTSVISVSGNNLYKMFVVNASKIVTVSGLTFKECAAQTGSIFYVNNSTVIANNILVTENTLSRPFFVSNGGSSISIANSTFSNNSSQLFGSDWGDTPSTTVDDSGYNNKISVTGSTFSGNSGVIFQTERFVKIDNCTFTSNTNKLGYFRGLNRYQVINSTFNNNTGSTLFSFYSALAGSSAWGINTLGENHHLFDNNTFSGNTGTVINPGTANEQLKTTITNNTFTNNGTNWIGSPQVASTNYLDDFITSVSHDPANSTVTATMSKAAYSAINSVGVLDVNDFQFSLTGGNATLASTTPSSISVSGNIYTLGIQLSGLADGAETLKVNPVLNSIYDLGNNIAYTIQKNYSTILSAVLNTAPQAVCNNFTAQLGANGSVTILASDVDGGSSDAGSTFTLTLDIDTFTCNNIGANSVTLTVTDKEGLTATCTSTVTVEDRIAPTVVTQNITIELDADGLASITAAQIDNGSTDNCSIESYSIDITSFDCSNVGENTVTLTVTDVNGNVSTGTSIVTIEDDVAPTPLTVASYTLQLDEFGSDISITAEDIDNGSTDNCEIASISIDKNTFDCANLGENTVTLTVTDVNGNVSTATTTITIQDVTSPIVITQNITIDLNDTIEATISVDDIDDGSMDSCGIATMTLDRTNFACANLGAYTVTLKVTDTSGNTTSEIAIVTVIGDDLDGDLITDNCDPDMDGDGVDNENDNCVRTFNSDQDDIDFNGIGDVCDDSALSFIEATGFSPNGDGIRDTFIIEGLAQYGDNELEVYNRWGNKVFSTQFYQNDWDGISNGNGVFSKNEKLPAGPYFYVLTAGYNKVYKGWMYINY